MILERRKANIQNLLKDIEEESILVFIEQTLHNFLQQPKAFYYAKNLKAKIVIEELKNKQNYQSKDIQKFAGVWASDSEKLKELLEDL